MGTYFLFKITLRKAFLFSIQCKSDIIFKIQKTLQNFCEPFNYLLLNFYLHYLL